MTDAEPRWSHLINTAFHLEETGRGDRGDLVRALDSVLEVFDAEVDPVDDVRAYAVRRLALSLRRVLEASG